MHGEVLKWYQRPIVIILLLFFVLGPFALPLLFRSPAFTLKWKLILTTLVVVYTVYLVIVTVEIVRGILRSYPI